MNTPTSDASWSGRIRLVGDLERPDHSHLEREDVCCFFGEYTARKGYAHSSTNNLIFNLKKNPTRRGTEEWKYKLCAIETAACLIRHNLQPDTLLNFTFVPAPPSKSPRHPEYDDRNRQIIDKIAPNADVRPLLETVVERHPAHPSDRRPDPEELEAGMRICEEALQDPASIEQIILLDDLLVTGATLVACRRKLRARFPLAKVFGLFIARRVPERSLSSGL